ncbi:LysR family transcriptional regulator [Rhodoferax koreense]|uniref:LysR family transcriptional regulator n=1 Tax=Rhodoferax koreensis TaxID=1842727 RepID=A0A1P8K1Z5_9BURK|nr:LysR substrate-binding domain-containing protein [Rhodoferax koreense]APW40017.1 LysR family transcriptional regulator [Rhodoferax koreense]
MDLTRLHYFVAVVEGGSFSRGAAALHMSQPALSRQVLLLEQEVGQALLVRTGRGAEPTEAGLALLAHARGIFELADRARADMFERQASPRGRVIVGLPPRVAHVLTADLVERFRAEYPDAIISMVEGLSIRLREWVVAGKLDMAILFDPPHSPQIEEETLAREPLVLIGPAPLPRRVRLADVAALPLVMPSGPNALRQLLERETRPRGLPLQVVAEVDSVQTVLSLVARGVSHTVLPQSALRLWTYDQPLHMAPIQSPAIRNRLVLAVPKARPATKPSRFAVQLLRALALEHYGGSPAQVAKAR